MKPVLPTLYCFEFDEETTEITRREIISYTIIHPYTLDRFKHIEHYKFKYEGRNITVKDESLDKFLNWKVYTFNDSFEFAKGIIYEDINNRFMEYEKQYKRYKTLLENLK